MILAVVLPIIPTWLAAVIGPFINAYVEVVTASLLAASASNSTIYEPSELAQKDDSCIRLLKILPGRAGRPVVCKLEVTDLSSLDVPPYEALSYVWGSPDMNEQIEINGHKINVSQVLLQALLHLRSATTPRTLWVDALCINQFDLTERSSQVLLMPLIYSKATRVVVWLGESEPWGLYYAIECAKSLEVSNPRASTSVPEFHFGVAYVAAKLLRRSYWTRVWVVQELVLAKDILVACGRFTCQWETLHQIVAGSAYHSFFPTNHVYLDEFLALETSHKLRASTQRNTHRDADLNFESALMATDDSRAPDLVSLWYRYRSRKATDPRDKVFAFIGLADSSYDLLQPDYSRRASFLSIELANQHIRYSRTLSVMALAESARVRSQNKPSSTNDYREAYIPSWCPAFMTNDSKTEPEFRLFWTGLPGDERENFHATGHVPVLAVPTQSSAQIGESLHDPDIHFLEIDLVSNFGVTISSDGRLSGHWDELVASSMTAGRRQETTWNWKLAEKLLASNGQGGGSRLTKNSNNDVFGEELIHLTLTAGKFSYRPSLDDDRQHRLYHEAQRQACLGRRLFVTADGRLGLGPEDLKSGDALHIALGIGAPVILRKTITEWKQSTDQVSDIYNSTWLYIGQAYVHDMMNYKGDLTADIDSGRVTLERRKLT
ncbi:hypothetical protein E8E14_005478 [Neopestalotiopsis sp. 37M]|nr:hypothetical protein E8E14_005478 [Neopestalotiopsis sp. 37M]